MPRPDFVAERLDTTSFYIRRARVMAKACVLLAVVLGALNLVNLSLAMNPPPTLYYATGPGKPPVTLQPLFQPLPTTAEAMEKSEKAVRLAFEGPTASLMDQQRRVTALFTDREQAERYRLRVVDGALRQLIEGHEYLHMVLDQEPRLISEGIENGLYTWVVEMRVRLYGGAPPPAGGAVDVASLGTPVARWRISIGLVQLLRQRGEEMMQVYGISRLVIPELSPVTGEPEDDTAAEEIAPL